MIDVKVLFGKGKDEFDYFYSYQPIVDQIGKVAVQVDDNDYQGDSRVLFHQDGGQIGYLNFGWGSCSGCDALQACSSWEELQDLCDSMEQSTRWFADAAEALNFFVSHDWEGDYSWHSDEQKEFIAKATEYLKNLVDRNA